MGSTHVKEANIKNSLDATPEDICDPLNRPKYDAAIHCSLALEISCTPYVYQTLLPDEKNLKKAQDTMCANLDVLNHTCTVKPMTPSSLHAHPISTPKIVWRKRSWNAERQILTYKKHLISSEFPKSAQRMNPSAKEVIPIPVKKL